MAELIEILAKLTPFIILVWLLLTVDKDRSYWDSPDSGIDGWNV